MLKHYDDRGRLWSVPEGVEPGGTGTCRGCQAIVLWVKTAEGKNRPYNADGVLHFQTCSARPASRAEGRGHFNEPPAFYGIETVEPHDRAAELVPPIDPDGPQRVGDPW